MFQVFARGGRKTFSDNDLRTPLSNGSSHGESPVRHVHVAILGTGFAGLGMAIRLKQEGHTDFVVLERAADIGGTWRDNTYPGYACDIPSHLYSFSFALNPNWSRAYSPQREIQDYLRSCAKRFGILPHIQWNSELQQAAWNEDDHCWHLTTAQGQLIDAGAPASSTESRGNWRDPLPAGSRWLVPTDRRSLLPQLQG